MASFLVKLSILVLLAALPLAQQCTVTQDSDIEQDTIASYRGSKPEDCCGLCASHKGCGGFVWISDESEGGICGLKGSAGPLVPAEGVFAGSIGSGGGGGKWRLADLIYFESYPECDEFNSCEWSGYFAFLPEQQTEEWVAENNIIGVHSKDAGQYKLKTLRLRQGEREINATVYDMCADSYCDGCCTTNSQKTRFLINAEKNTMERFGSGSGIVEWSCLDCDE